jgi:anti-sigma factor RsiW
LRSGPDVMASAMASAPVVAGFQLTASHMDIVAGHIAQVSVYTKDGQTITLSSWPANGEPAHGVKHAQYRGMAIAYWNDGKTEFWAASTSPTADVQGFVAELTAS